MSDISLTASMRTNLLSLQNTQSLQGIQTIKAANEGIEAITSFVQQAKAVANTARDTAMNVEIKSGGSFVNNIAEAATGGPANTQKMTLKVGDVTLEYDVKGSIEGGAAADDLDKIYTGLTTGANQTKYGAANFTIEKVTDGGTTVGFSIKAKDTTQDYSASISLEGGMGLSISGKIDTAARDTSMKQYNDILTQIDQLASDASYKGVNLLKGDDLKVIFNEDRSSFIEVKGDDATAGGLGLTAVEDWSTNEKVDATITAVEGAITELRNMASEFGNNYSIVQTRQDFTENLMNVLTEGADDLTLADMNEESANMLALQTRQQLGVNALSLASQSAQSVLSLF